MERLTLDVNGDLIYTFTQPWSDGTTGIKLSPLELLEKLAAWVPPPRVHQVRYAGCLAAHSKLRGAITPTPRQQGIEQASPVSSRWAVGTLAQASVFPRHGALSALSVRQFADHRRHHLPARHPSHFVPPQAGG